MIKNIKPILSLVLCTFMFANCSDEQQPVNDTKLLTIHTDITKTRALKTVFSPGDEMGIYAKVNSSLNSGWYNKVTGVSKATYNGSTWALSPDIVLTNNAAYIFAYFPFSSLVTDPETIPVSTEEQVDYLYGGTSNTASNANNVLTLKMSHVQANFRFNVINMGYNGDGVLKSVRIGNKSGKTTLYTGGTFNAATGNVTGIAGSNASYTIAGINKTAEAEGWTANLPSAMIIPFNPVAKGDVEFVFEIDNKTYAIECPLQEGGYAKGQQYTFNLKLTGKNLELNQEDITIEPWDDNNVNLDDVLTRGNAVNYTVVTKSTNQVVRLPQLGISSAEVSFGDGQGGAYTPGLVHTYASAGTYEVVISSEAELSKIEFADISSVAVLDLSNMGSI